jgi:heptaprenyl diphosphate synthase
MQSQDNYRIAILSAYAIGLHSAESLLPTPIPWLKLGIANIVTVITLIVYGIRPAITVTLIRVILTSLLHGTFLGPAFMLSLGGGMASTLIMGIILYVVPTLFSAIGISVIGALFHNITQLFLAYFLFIQKIEAILLITPLIVLIGTLTGMFNGIVSELILKNLKKYEQKSNNS